MPKPSLTLLLPLLLIACDGGEKANPDTEPLASGADADADGFAAEDDCDDANALVNPGAAEDCDGIDNNCDGQADEGAMSPFYLDADGDGYGADGDAIEACAAPTGYAAEGGDCNDTDTDYNPGASDDCADPHDYNCDGSVAYADVDEDGAAACEDCDDNDAAVSVADAWYADDDGDGFGGEEILACSQPAGTVGDDTDCDDANAAAYPGADEVCDEADNDCDGATDVDDADVTDAGYWYTDADGDGYGDEDAETFACDRPIGTVDNASDCDDGDAAVFEGCAGTFDGTTGTAWQKLSITSSQYPNSLMSYHPSDFDYIYNICSGTQRYDPLLDAWSAGAASPPYSCSWASPAAYDGDLWMIRNGGIYHYDPDFDVWTTLGSYTGSEDYNMTVADESGVIYGHNNAGEIVAYDSATGSVTYYSTGLGSQNQTRLAYDPADNALFFGGAFGSNLYRFDLATHAVTATTPHPEGFVSDTFCGDQSGHIYAAGGSTGTTMWQYDIASNSWSKIPDLPSDQGVNGSCTVSADGWLYVGVPESSLLAFYRIELY